MTRYILFFSIISLLMASCRGDFFDQVVEIDPPTYEGKMVMSEIYSNYDTVARALIRRNFGLLEDLDKQETNLANVSARILKDGQPWATFTYLPDEYEANYQCLLPEPFEYGHSYTFEAEHADFPSTSATQTLPKVVENVSVVYDPEGGFDFYGDRLGSVDISFDDPADEANFYGVKVLYYQLQVLGQDTIRYGPYEVYFDNSNNIDAQYGIGDFMVISDELFNGERALVNYQFPNYYDDNQLELEVHFYHLNEATFKNLITRQRVLDTQDFPFAEPVTVFSNLDNGIGLFGLANEQVYKIK